MCLCVVSVTVWRECLGAAKREERRLGMLRQASFLIPDTYPGQPDFFFFFSMFESRAKSFLQGIVSGMLPSLFLLKEKTSV